MNDIEVLQKAAEMLKRRWTAAGPNPNLNEHGQKLEDIVHRGILDVLRSAAEEES